MTAIGRRLKEDLPRPINLLNLLIYFSTKLISVRWANCRPLNQNRWELENRVRASTILNSFSFSRTGIPINQQHLIYNQKELNDATEVKDIPLVKGSRLKWVLGLKCDPVSARRIVTLPEFDTNFSDVSNHSIINLFIQTIRNERNTRYYYLCNVPIWMVIAEWDEQNDFCSLHQ